MSTQSLPASGAVTQRVFPPVPGTQGPSATRGEVLAPPGPHHEPGPHNDPAGAAQRTEALIARTAAMLRVVQVVPWPVAMALGSVSGVQHVGLAIAVYVAQTAWSLIWVATVVTQRRMPTWSLLIDVPVAAASLVLSGLACFPGDATSWANSAVAPAMGTAVAVAAAWPRLWSAGAGAVLCVAYLIGVAPAFGKSSTAAASAVGNICSLLGFAVLAGMISHHLLRQAREVGTAALQLAEAQARTADEQSREHERTRQYRMLHDTVLSTLSALARGGLDPDDPLVRQRCAADADYLRSLISTGPRSAGDHLLGELAAVARSQGALGLRVHVRCADIGADVPDTVVRALSDAAREALNNVIKHSGADQAWVTARGRYASSDAASAEESAIVVVTVTDRGRGFDPGRTPAGLGLRDSVEGRMAEIGGAASVDSSPGQGTLVELRWPR